MKNKIVLKIILFFIAFVNIFIIQNKVFAVDMEQITYFEDIGKYSIAIAGNNNACRGTASYQGFYLIKDYPSNWNQIKNNIPSDIVSRINNISGSYLDFDGTVAKAWITTMYTDKQNDYEHNSQKDVLIIKPDGSYELLTKATIQTLQIDITQKGYYYVSILDADVNPQQAWAITCVYKNDTLSNKYVKVVYPKMTVYLTDGSSVDIMYNSRFELKDEFEIFGIIIAGGDCGFPLAGSTEDKFEAILEDGSIKQLYEDQYNGKTIFKGRTSTDFANGTFNTIRTHDIQGGELDIFNEKLGRDYFSNKGVLGYRVTKIGSNVIMPQLMGIAQEIYSPKIGIKTTIKDATPDSIIKDETMHITVNVSNLADDETGKCIAYDSKITSYLDECLSNASNITVKYNGNEYSGSAVYDSTTNSIILGNIPTINPLDEIIIEYDAVVNNKIENKGDINSTITLNTNAKVITYPMDMSKFSDSEKEKYNSLYLEAEDSDNTTGSYKVKAGNVVIKYIDKMTNKNIADDVTIEGYIGDTYTTESKSFNGYVYDSVYGQVSGVLEETSKIITYYYIKESDVTVKYIDENTGNEIDGVDSVTTTYKEKDPYTTEKKTIEGYTYTRDTENTSGTVGRTNIEVIYYYKRNSEVTAKYIDKNTQEVIATEVNKKGLEGDSYTTEQKTISGYVYDSVVGDASGNLKANPTEVIYYYIKQSKVITKYVDMYTDGEIAERVNITYKEGDLYSTTRKNITGYTYEKVTENASGTVAREDIEVTYYYKKNTSVAVKYIDIYTDEEIADSEKLSGVQGDPYTTIQKDIDSYKFVEVSGDTEGNMGADPKEIVYKYVKQADVYVECIDEITGVLIGRVDPVRYSEKENYTTESLSIEGYTLTRDSSNTSGVMGRENILVKYYYKKNTSVTVKYIDMVTKEEIANKEVITGLEKQDYETSKKTITGYEYIEVTGKTSGQMEREPQEVVYKYKKQSNLITEHIDANSGEKIIDDIVKTYKEGDTYEALAQNLGGYILVEEPETKTGIMEREDIVKTFKYKKISSGLVVKYVDKMTGELLDIVTYDGNEKDVINLEEKWFKYYVVYSRPDFTQIELKVEPQEVIYYYVRSSEVPVEGIDQDTREVLYETKVTGVEGNNYTTEPRILEGYELVKVPENKEGIFGRNNLKVTYEYKKIAGKVTVRYVNRETKEEIESYEITGKVGDSYQTEAREYENLKLVEVKGNEVGTLEKEEKEVVYYYERKTGKVVVRYEDTEGNELLKEEMSGKVGQEYKAKFKNIEGYELIEIPENEEGTYIDGTIEVVYKYIKIEVKPIEKGKIIINFVDKDGNILLERIMVENEVGKEFYMELPEIEGYRIVGDKVIKAKFENGELLFDAVYEKIEEEIPATGDINVILHVALAVTFLAIILKSKKNILN